ncbi:MAG: InlB B-repeat-containing protein [Eubacteriales bacterium]|nr:InlB B-repeat-containing protein [Eubacteriales bacterium]
MKKKLFAVLLAVFLAAGVVPLRVLGAEAVTVTFHLMGGHWSNDDCFQYRTFEAGHVLSAEDIPDDMSPNDGYGGGYWKDDPLGDVPSDGAVYRFVYQKLLELTFDANGGQWGEGETDRTVQVLSGTVCEDWPEDPVRAGYRFLDWCQSPYGYGSPTGEDEEIEESLTLYARWKENCRLTFQLNGGSGELPEMELSGGLVEDLPEPPPREGYEFHRWNTALDGTGTDLEPRMELQEHTTAYAQWRRIFILCFDGNSGVSVETMEFTAENSGVSAHDFTVPGLERPGHTLLGWNTQPDGSGETVAAGSLYTVDSAQSPATLYAIWQRSICQVTFGETGEIRACLWGDSLPADGFPALSLDENGCRVIDGALFRFGGWQTEDGQLFTVDTPVTESLALHPLWIAQEEVRFEIAGGIWAENGLSSRTVTLDEGGALEGLLPTPIPDELHNPTGQWSPKPGTAAKGSVFTYTCDRREEFQITFDTDEPPVEVLEGQTCPKLPTPAREGFRFDGWYTAETGGERFDESLPILKNTHLYARWVRIFTLTYDPSGGENPPPQQQVEAGENAMFTISHQVPTRPGWAFLGWAESPDGSLPQLHGGDPCRVDGDLTLYALWKRDLVLVTVVFLDRETESARLSLVSGQCPGGAMAEAPARPGYDFLGWNTSWDGSGEALTADSVVESDTTVYACWAKIPTVTLTFLDRGQAVDWFTLAVGESPADQLPAAPVRKGYLFLGWQDENGTLLAAEASVTQDMTLCAAWEKITRGTVTFLDGEGEPREITLDLGAKLGDNLPPDPTRPGFRFLGWNTREDGTGSKLYRSTVLREDLTVWAQWEEIQYVTVTFHDPFEGSFSLTLEQNTKPGDRFPANPTRPGYSFRGWYTGENGNGQKVTKSTKIGEDTHLYACWKRKDPTNARTADPSNIHLWTAILAVTAMSLTGIVWKKRR